MIAVKDILDAVQTYGEPHELAALVDGLAPVLSKVPVEALMRLAEAATKAAAATTELGAMKAAVAGADAAVDAAEAAALAEKAKP